MHLVGFIIRIYHDARSSKCQILHHRLPFTKCKVTSNMLGGSVHTVRENAEDLVVATKENELEVNADKTKYMIMSRDQNAGRSYSMKTDNSSIERVVEFKYLGTTLTNKNSIQEEIKSRLKLGNACYYSAQNLLSSSLLSKKLKIKIYRTIILPVVLYGWGNLVADVEGGT